MAAKANKLVSINFDTGRIVHTDPKGYSATDRFKFLSKTTRIAVLKACGFQFTGMTPLRWTDDALEKAWFDVTANRSGILVIDGDDTKGGDDTPAPIPTTPKETPMPTKSTTTTEGGLDALLRSAILEVLGDFIPEPDADKIHNLVSASVAPFIASNEELMLAVDELSNAVEQRLPRITRITVPNREPKDIDGVLHNKFNKVMSAVNERIPTYLVGPAGTGKSTIGEQVSQALGLTFSATSLCAQTMSHDILGYMDANGRYVETGFYKAFKHGGVKLFDEVDNGNPNVLSVINSALSNSFMEFPNGEMVRRHDDFVVIATANTFGNGATSDYVGRNPLDKAFKSRFIDIEIDIDPKVEEAMLAGVGLADDRASRWLEIVRTCRTNVERYGLKVLVTPRATLNGAKLLCDTENWTYGEVARATILGGLSPEQAAKVTEGVALV